MPFDHCFITIDDCIATRRCFMTGEFCSKQMLIQRERSELHSKNQINAFVIMNFSNMSDIVYKWHIKSYIESLKKYLYFERVNDKAVRLHCYSTAGTESESRDKAGLTQVAQINVVRSDTNPSSNFVMCSRVCQQLQIADLVIVDVSIENTNVFYELGMAAAMGKLILPICYSEIFYERALPTKLKELMNKDYNEYEKVEHHIGCYPWRKKLFEHFGIRYRRKDCFNHGETGHIVNPSEDITRYLEYDSVIKNRYGFADRKYCMFPYNEKARAAGDSDGSSITGAPDVSIGKTVYEKLKNAYNTSTNEENTLVVYTMDGILNESEAGLCIVNYYISIVERMKAEHCFCGDRVGVLVQSNVIPEDVKDSDEKKHVLYNVGEIIHIGMNQATYKAIKNTVTAEDYLRVDDKVKLASSDEATEQCKNDIDRFVKEYVRNRCIMIYPNEPVYVKRVQNGMQADIFDRSCNFVENTGKKSDSYFCLYHVMLRTLKYTNEIVVDVSTNSVQALFWLGAAHGSDVYAISVRNEQTQDERMITAGSAEQKERSIFDISGLWTAILHSYDIEGFYKQLTLAQTGIEQNTRLLNKDNERYEEELLDTLYKENEEDAIQKSIIRTVQRKRDQSRTMLESYYRDKFWRMMTKSNQLYVYFPQIDGNNVQDKGPSGHNAQWDVDAIGAISHNLSKRNNIGEYCIRNLGAREVDERSKRVNFLCVGGAAKPLPDDAGGDVNQSLASYISRRVVEKDKSVLYEHVERYVDFHCPPTEGQAINAGGKALLKGLRRIDSEEQILTQISQVSCYKCLQDAERSEHEAGWGTIMPTAEAHIDGYECRIRATKLRHTQLAQLLLWRERDADRKMGDIHYWVSLSGVSGPSTLALTSVLLDGEQQETLFVNDSVSADANGNVKANPDSYPLTSMQASIRKRIIKEYSKRLRKALLDVCERTESMGEDQRGYYCERVIYATVRYLSVTLYKYFLPFISAEDESRICNGMRTYVYSMMVEGISPFARKASYNADFLHLQTMPDDVVEQCARHAYMVLKTVLESLRGVEALFKVHVAINEEKVNKAEKSDTRVIHEIKYLYSSEVDHGVKSEDEQDPIYVNCLLTNE